LRLAKLEPTAAIANDAALKGVKTMFTQSCRSVVLMHEAAKAIAAVDVGVRRLSALFRFRRLKRESAMGALSVVGR